MRSRASFVLVCLSMCVNDLLRERGSVCVSVCVCACACGCVICRHGICAYTHIHNVCLCVHNVYLCVLRERERARERESFDSHSH